MPGSTDLSPVRLRQLVWAPLIGTLIGVVLVVAISTVWLSSAMRGGRPDFAALQGSFYLNMAIIAAIYLPITALFWNAAGKLTPAPAIRFFKPVSNRSVLLALATGVAASLLCLGLEALLSSTAGISFELSPAEKALFPATPVQLGFAVVVMGFVGPFAEEFYFRGFLLQWLRQHMGAWPAIGLSALAFGLVHFFMLIHPGASGWVTTGEIVGVGIVMGLWAVRTGSLWSSFAVHVGYNCVVVMQTFLPG